MLWIITTFTLFADNPFIPSSKPIKGEPVDNAFKFTHDSNTGQWSLEYVLFPDKVSFPYLYVKSFTKDGTDYKGLKLNELYSVAELKNGKAMGKVAFSGNEVLAAVGFGHGSKVAVPSSGAFRYGVWNQFFSILKADFLMYWTGMES